MAAKLHKSFTSINASLQFYFSEKRPLQEKRNMKDTEKL